MKNLLVSQSYLRKRKMMLVIPLLILPFVTLAFWALGGGKSPSNELGKASEKQGLNLQLPNPRLKDEKGLNKLSYYEIAEADSEKLKERMRSDPYFKIGRIGQEDSVSQTGEDTLEASTVDQYAPSSGLLGNHISGDVNRLKDPNEQKILNKLLQLDKALNSTVSNSSSLKGRDDAVSKPNGLLGDFHQNQYNEEAIESIHDKGKTADPEMNQIDGMLDKIMDIQHPERLTSKYKPNPQRRNDIVFAVSRSSGGNEGFYAIDDNDSSFQDQNAIEAAVYETQTLVNGAIVKMRLLRDVYVKGVLIPRDILVYGIVTLAGERLNVAISTILYKQFLLPVDMSVYDLDGLIGIYIPGAISRDVAKQSADNALQAVALNSLDPSLSAQAASAGIETAKNLISKKVKLVRVTVKAGYHILLKDNNSKL